MRILVADDNHDAAESLAVLFDLTGHEVRTAFDGLNAVEVARQWPPDAAVLDLQMPVLDGRAVAAILRSRLPDVVLVALSGQMNAQEMKVCRAVFDLCFAKGVEFQEVSRKMVATMYERHHPSSDH